MTDPQPSQEDHYYVLDPESATEMAYLIMRGWTLMWRGQMLMLVGQRKAWPLRWDVMHVGTRGESGTSGSPP